MKEPNVFSMGYNDPLESIFRTEIQTLWRRATVSDSDPVGQVDENQSQTLDELVKQNLLVSTQQLKGGQKPLTMGPWWGEGEGEDCWWLLPTLEAEASNTDK